MKTEQQQADVCPTCHASVQTDDWSSFDLYTETPEESQELYDELTANAYYLDPAEFPRSHDDNGGYWECWVCNDAQLGTAYRYLTHKLD